MIRHLRYILITAVAMLTTVAWSGDASWSFDVPPSDQWRKSVNADWRSHGKVSVDVKLVSDLPQEQLLCSFYFITKQDWWFESRKPIILDGTLQTFRLSLDDFSPDWASPQLRRTYGPDVLRWVREWGVKIYSAGACKGTLQISPIRFAKVGDPLPRILKTIVPREIRAGTCASIGFEIAGYRGDLYDPAKLGGILRWEGNGKKGRAPLFFCQDYSPIRVPGKPASSLIPTGRPRLQANWTPPGPGPYKLTASLEVAGTIITKDLGRLKVEAKASKTRVLPGKRFVRSCTRCRLFEYKAGTWVLPQSGQSAEGSFWRGQLDWTPAWGHYTGLGEFDQLISWQLDQAIRSGDPSKPLPLLLFSEDELDDHGTYNWIDNPLNSLNGGGLQRPRELFLSAEAKQVLRRRAHYLWARYGSLPQVSGLLIRLNRPHNATTSWIQQLAAEIGKDLPGVKLLADNLGLPKREFSIPLALHADWERDIRLSRFSFISPNPGRGEILLEGRYPGSTAIIARKLPQHWLGARVFSVDVNVSEASGPGVKVMCFMRTDPNMVYQSELKWLREDDWNRVYFHLDKPDQWTCLSDPKHKMSRHELLNIKEVALRFFCDDHNEVMLKVRNSRILGPYSIDTAQDPKLAISNLKGKAEKVTQYERFELSFDLNREFRNPYDPDQIDVSITISDPAGNVFQHPGFYHEPWQLKLENGRERIKRAGMKPSWRIRYTPSVPGNYKWLLRARTATQAARVSGTFTCTPGKKPGFVRVSKKDERLFEFTNGDFFYPVGHNLRSPSDRRPKIYEATTLANADWADRVGVFAYEKWFKKMKENGMNFTRIWMSPWWLGLEWNATYPGYHGNGYYNQENAARMDAIMDMAAKHDIYINLETINHGCLSSMVDSDWQNNPLSKTQPGGFVKYASDFFTSERALKLHRHKLRYTVARWGYSPQIALWGAITEGEWAEAYHRNLPHSPMRAARPASYIPDPYKSSAHVASMRKWLMDTCSYIKDTNGHAQVVTTHFSMPMNGEEMWFKEPIEVVYNNAYTFFTKMWQQDRFYGSKGVNDIIYEYGRYFSKYGDRPLLIAEWGGHPHRNLESHLLTELHTGTWASFMSDVSGITGYWWWNLIDAHDAYGPFRAITNFAKGEDRRGKRMRSARARVRFPNETGVTYGDVSRRGLVLYGDKELFAYIYPGSINRVSTSSRPKSFNDTAFSWSGDGQLTVPGRVDAGTYKVEYWDTFTGKVVKTTQVTIDVNNRTIPLINHRVDLAVKMKQIPKTAGSQPTRTPARR